MPLRSVPRGAAAAERTGLAAACRDQDASPCPSGPPSARPPRARRAPAPLERSLSARAEWPHIERRANNMPPSRDQRSDYRKAQPLTRQQSIRSVRPHMPGLELKLLRDAPREVDEEPKESPRITAASRKLERHRQIEEMYQMALQRKRAVALREATDDDHILERYLASKPPSILAMPAALTSRPSNTIFESRERDHRNADRAVDSFFLTQTPDELNTSARPVLIGGTHARPIASARPSRSPRSIYSSPRAASAPPRPAPALLPTGAARWHAEQQAEAAIRAALQRSRAVAVGDSIRALAVGKKATHMPLSMTALECQYPSLSPRTLTVLGALNKGQQHRGEAAFLGLADSKGETAHSTSSEPPKSQSEVKVG
eukprot:scaffold124187_cov31-Tisochrysis_lutea.AAC.3